MMGDDTEILSNAINTFESLTKKPELYLSVQDDKAALIKATLKNLYDFMKSNEELNINNDALQRLIIENFDEEQIWQQLELQNNSTWPGFITNVSKLYSNRKHLQFYHDDVDHNDNGVSEIDENQLEEEVVSNKDNSSDSDDSSDEEDNRKYESQNTRAKSSKIKGGKKTHKSSIVDDKFFKLRELEQFLNEEDRKEMNGVQSKSDDEDDDDDEESVDLFEDLDSDAFSDDDDENEDNDKIDDENDSEKYPKYADFFDAPDDQKNDKSVEDEADLENSDISLEDVDNDSDDNSKESVDLDTGKKRVRFELNQSDDDDRSDDELSLTDLMDKEDSNMNSEEMEEKSTFEIRQERLKKKISHLENAALSEKPWQLKGEIDASNRPQNSLLEEVLEFDVSTRPAPVITQETTLKLEDIIRRRIKDKAWDDVERKIKPIDAPLEYKKELVLNQEKSKESLAQIYEQEYLKQKAALDPELSERPAETPKEHTEIKQMMTTLFSQLDALSNFHYTPKTVTPEVKIVNNLPAISMEEVAPVATSDATLLAPEEIHKKPKGDIIGKDERTKTDKNRERRQKKLRQRIKQREQERKEKLKPNGAMNKDRESKLINKLSKDRNIDKLVANNKVAKSSQAFFTQLQEEVRGQIKSKITSTKKQDKNKITAKKVKL